MSEHQSRMPGPHGFPRDLLVPLHVHGDERGSLVSLGRGDTVPFDIQRVYYIFGTAEGVRRGRHAHRTCRQLVVCVRGSCTISLDDGRSRLDVPLSATDPCALLVEPLVWHEMFAFSQDCVLVVLASDLYDESDYVRSYDTFRAVIGVAEDEQA